MWFFRSLKLLMFASWHWMLCGWYREKYDRLGQPIDKLKAEAHELLGDLAGSEVFDHLPK